jgi:hypothetical protein
VIVRYLPVRRVRLSLDSAATASGVHPELLERFVELGLVDAEMGRDGQRWFARTVPARVQLAMRLHADLSLNYAAVALVLELLARIDSLENTRHVIRPDREKPTWT